MRIYFKKGKVVGIKGTAGEIVWFQSAIQEQRQRDNPKQSGDA